MRLSKIAITIICIFCVSLIGCSSKRHIKVVNKEFEETVPYCQGEEDCKEKWNASQAWVASNCKMEIKTLSETIIETYNTTGNSKNLACRVNKIPQGNDKYRIEITTWCHNPIGCFPDAWEAAINFNDYVNRF